MRRVAVTIIVVSTLAGALVSSWAQVCAWLVGLVLMTGPVSLALCSIIGLAGAAGLPIYPKSLFRQKRQAEGYSPLGLAYRRSLSGKDF